MKAAQIKEYGNIENIEIVEVENPPVGDDQFGKIKLMHGINPESHIIIEEIKSNSGVIPRGKGIRIPRAVFEAVIDGELLGVFGKAEVTEGQVQLKILEPEPQI